MDELLTTQDSEKSGEILFKSLRKTMRIISDS